MAFAALEGKRDLHLERAKSAGSMLLRAMAGAALYFSPIFIATLFTKLEPLPALERRRLPLRPHAAPLLPLYPDLRDGQCLQKAQGKGRIRAGARQAQPRHHPHQVPELGVPHRPGIPLAPIAALLVIVLVYDVIAMASEAAALIFLMVVFCLPIIQVAYILVMLLLTARSTATSGKRA